MLDAITKNTLTCMSLHVDYLMLALKSRAKELDMNLGSFDMLIDKLTF